MLENTRKCINLSNFLENSIKFRKSQIFQENIGGQTYFRKISIGRGGKTFFCEIPLITVVVSHLFVSHSKTSTIQSVLTQNHPDFYRR